MLITLWNYLRGYVMIEVTGFSVERFVNLAVHKGVYIWDVQYIQDSVSMKVSVKAFKLLKSCAKKTKCHIKIKQKTGWPFVLYRYRKRKLLGFGIVFFIFILYFLSTFVWLIEIHGVARIDPQDILTFSREHGLQIGSFSRRVDTKALGEALKNHFPDISWINIYIQGTKATITLTETIPKQMIIDRSMPCDIIAAKDGLITSIATSAGTPIVTEKDVVKKGDVLVSGELIVKNEDLGIILKEYVHAEASVLARLYYDIKFEVPYQYIEKQYTGRTKKTYSLDILGYSFTLPNILNRPISFESFDKSTRHQQWKFGEHYPLPIILTIVEYHEFIPMEKKRTLEQAKELSQTILTGRIIREFDFEADIVDKVMNITETPDSLQIKATITTIEDIAEERMLIEKTDDESTAQISS